MNPDIDLRLKSVMKALSDVILPALPAHERLARDQANLVLGHLAIIAGQWPHALDYELQNLALASHLASELAGLTIDSALADELIAALEQAAAVERGNYLAVSHAHRALKGVIDKLIMAEHGDPAVDAATASAVLRYNRQRAPLERIWHRDAGLDPDAATLPALATLFERRAR